MRRILSVIISVLITITAISQTTSKEITSDILSVYTNDGEITILRKAVVDSMRLSVIDIDSVAHKEFITQEIFTADSVYRFPLESIDSICLQPMPIVLCAGVKDLESKKLGLKKFILGASKTFDHLYLTNETPKNLLPRKGEILVSDESSEELPFGFVGRVVEVKQSSDYIDLTCEMVEMSEVYESYCRIIETTVPKNDFLRTKASRADSGDENDEEEPWSYVGRFEWPTVGISNDNVSVGFDDLDFDIPVNNSDEFEHYIGNEKGVTASLSLESDATFVFVRYMDAAKKMFLAVDFETRHKLEIQVGFNGEAHYNPPRKPILTLPEMRLPGLAWATINSDFGFIASVNGEIRAVAEPWIEYKTNSHFRMCLDSNTSAENDAYIKTNFIDGGINAGMYGEATARIGVYASLNFNAINRRALQISTRAETGIEFSAKASLKLDEFLNAKESPALYNRLTDESALSIYRYSSLVIEESLFGGLQRHEIFRTDFTQSDNPIWNSAIIPKLEITGISDLNNMLSVYKNIYYQFGNGLIKNGINFTLNYDVVDHSGKSIMDGRSIGSQWGYSWNDNGSDYFTIHLVNPLQYAKVITYATLSLGEKEYHALTDQEIEFDPPRQPDISISHSYAFVDKEMYDYDKSGHMFHVEAPEPNLEKLENVNEYGVYIIPARSLGFTPNEFVNDSISGRTYNEIKRGIQETMKYHYSDDIFVAKLVYYDELSFDTSHIPYIAISAEEKEYTYHFPCYVGYYAKQYNRIDSIMVDDEETKVHILSCRFMDLSKSFSTENDISVTWTPKYTQLGDRVLTIYIGNYVFTIDNPFIIQVQGELFGLEDYFKNKLNLSYQTLIWNPHLRNKVLYRNSPCEPLKYEYENGLAYKEFKLSGIRGSKYTAWSSSYEEYWYGNDKKYSRKYLFSPSNTTPKITTECK